MAKNKLRIRTKRLTSRRLNSMHLSRKFQLPRHPRMLRMKISRSLRSRSLNTRKKMLNFVMSSRSRRNITRVLNVKLRSQSRTHRNSKQS